MSSCSYSKICFVTSTSCVPDAQKSAKNATINNTLDASRETQTSTDRSEDVFVEYPVRVISVAVLAAVV